MRSTGLTVRTLQPVPAPSPIDSRRRGRKPVAVIKVTKLWPVSSRGGGAAAAAVSLPVTRGLDGLDAFGSEAQSNASLTLVDSDPVPEDGAKPRLQTRKALTWIGVITLSALAAAAATWQYARRGTVPPTSSLTVTTNPSGVEVLIA